MLWMELQLVDMVKLQNSVLSLIWSQIDVLLLRWFVSCAWHTLSGPYFSSFWYPLILHLTICTCMPCYRQVVAVIRKSTKKSLGSWIFTIQTTKSCFCSVLLMSCSSSAFTYLHSLWNHLQIWVMYMVFHCHMLPWYSCLLSLSG